MPQFAAGQLDRALLDSRLCCTQRGERKEVAAKADKNLAATSVKKDLILSEARLTNFSFV
jgi:hypothetical protein